MKNMTGESCEQVDSSISGIWWSHAPVQLGCWDRQDFIRFRARWWPDAGSRPRPAPSHWRQMFGKCSGSCGRARAGAGHQRAQQAVAGISLSVRRERPWKWRAWRDQLRPHDPWPLTFNWGVKLAPSFLHQNLLITYYVPDVWVIGMPSKMRQGLYLQTARSSGRNWKMAEIWSNRLQVTFDYKMQSVWTALGAKGWPWP